MLMYGRQSTQTGLLRPTAFDPKSYSAHLSAKLAELQDFVEANLAAAAEHQRSAYDKHSMTRSFKIGDLVWLSRPTARKLDPRWEGDWRVTSLKGPLNVEITDGRRTRVVHVNWLHHRHQPSPSEAIGSDRTHVSDSDGLSTFTRKHLNLKQSLDIPSGREEPLIAMDLKLGVEFRLGRTSVGH